MILVPRVVSYVLSWEDSTALTKTSAVVEYEHATTTLQSNEEIQSTPKMSLLYAFPNLLRVLLMQRQKKLSETDVYASLRGKSI